MYVVAQRRTFCSFWPLFWPLAIAALISDVSSKDRSKQKSGNGTALLYYFLLPIAAPSHHSIVYVGVIFRVPNELDGSLSLSYLVDWVRTKKRQPDPDVIDVIPSIGFDWLATSNMYDLRFSFRIKAMQSC